MNVRLVLPASTVMGYLESLVDGLTKEADRCFRDVDWEAVESFATDLKGLAQSFTVVDVGPDLIALTPDEAHELYSLWLARGMKPPEIDPRHPLITGAHKLGEFQSDDAEEGEW